MTLADPIMILLGNFILKNLIKIKILSLFILIINFNPEIDNYTGQIESPNL